MAVDADAVLWALRGLHDSQGRGVRADDVARFMSKDATLSEDYGRDDVASVLDALVEDGVLTCSSTLDAGGTNEPSALVRYRVASGCEVLHAAVVGLPLYEDGDDLLSVDVEERYDFFLEALADSSDIAVPDSDTDALFSLRISELEEERDTLVAEQDALRARVDEFENLLEQERASSATWRQRAEVSEEQLAHAQNEGEHLRARTQELDDLLEQERGSLVVARQRAEVSEEQLAHAQNEGEQLRERVRRLEAELEEERVLGAERLETTRRAAAALADARLELDHLESPSVPRERPQASPDRHRKTLRGNWLE